MKYYSLILFLVAAVCGLCALTVAQAAQTRTFEVGPGKAYSAIGEVPWEALQPGDTVLIYWQAAPYQEKWVIGCQGTAEAPITVRGVPGPNGELPVVDGQNAVTRPALNYWNEARGLIKIGGSNIPADTTPQYITIENLDLRSARSPFTFTAADGSTQSYTDNAAAVYIEKGEHLTIRNCLLHESGNGLFIGSSSSQATRNILVEGNDIYDNGITDSFSQHNVYTAALGITFQANHLGPLRAGCLGNN